MTLLTLELLGADNLAHGQWGQSVIARLSHEEMPAAGSILHLYLPPAALHFLIQKADYGWNHE